MMLIFVYQHHVGILLKMKFQKYIQFQKASSPLEWFLMEVLCTPFSPETPGLSHPVKSTWQPLCQRHTQKVSAQELNHTSARVEKRSEVLLTHKKTISPCMERERCHRRHCRKTHQQVRSGDWGRRTRWLQPQPWNPPRFLKVPGGCSAHTPEEREAYHLISLF